jgi:hypothetical protein
VPGVGLLAPIRDLFAKEDEDELKPNESMVFSVTRGFALGDFDQNSSDAVDIIDTDHLFERTVVKLFF